MSWQVLETRTLHHGVLVAVSIGEGEPPADVLARLAADEAVRAAGYAAERRRTFVAGRLALRAALAKLGTGAVGGVLSSARGAPALPPGFVGSVSHKRALAVALVARADADGGQVGVDIEAITPPRGIEGRVLTDDELGEIAALPEPERPWAVLARFSIKEAVYKALDPFVGRHVGFKEARVVLGAPGRCAVSLVLSEGEGPFSVDAHWERHDAGALAGHFLATVRIKRSG